jgi:hypothetical protein
VAPAEVEVRRDGAWVAGAEAELAAGIARCAGHGRIELARR